MDGPSVDKRPVELVANGALVELKALVDHFNLSFEGWKKTFGCEANFTWSYKEGKVLLIQSIDLPVYRRPVGGGKTMAEVAKEFEKTTPLGAEKS